MPTLREIPCVGCEQPPAWVLALKFKAEDVHLMLCSDCVPACSAGLAGLVDYGSIQVCGVCDLNDLNAADEGEELAHVLPIRDETGEYPTVNPPEIATFLSIEIREIRQAVAESLEE